MLILILLFRFFLVFEGSIEQFLIHEWNGIGQGGCLIWWYRFHYLRGYQYQQLGIVSFESPASEQVPEDGDVAQSGDFGCRFEQSVVDKPRNRKTLPVFQPDFCLGFSCCNCRNGPDASRKADTVGIIERTDFRGDLQVDQIVVQNVSGKFKAHTEFLPENRKCQSSSGRSLCDGDG